MINSGIVGICRPFSSDTPSCHPRFCSLATALLVAVAVLLSPCALSSSYTSLFLSITLARDWFVLFLSLSPWSGGGRLVRCWYWFVLVIGVSILLVWWYKHKNKNKKKHKILKTNKKLFSVLLVIYYNDWYFSSSLSFPS